MFTSKIEAERTHPSSDRSSRQYHQMSNEKAATTDISANQALSDLVQRALELDEYLSSQSLRAVPVGNVIALRGEVQSPKLRERATKVAMGVYGVTFIANQIQVAATQQSSKG